MVDDDDLAALLARGSAQDACDALVGAALDAGGVDNVTVVVASF
jgi:serine/threonine protein phosphatase PrpC